MQGAGRICLKLSSDGSFWNLMKKLRQNLTAFLPAYFPIAYKLALVFTLLISCGMALLGLFIVHNQSNILEQQVSESGNTVLRLMAEFSREPLLANDHLNLEIVVKSLAGEAGILGAALYNENKALVVKKGMVPDDRRIVAALGRVIKLEWRKDVIGSSHQLDMVSFFKPVLIKDVTAGYALITFDQRLRTLAQQETIRAVGGATLLLVILGFIASFILGKRLTRPIHQLINAGRAISAGDYHVRLNDLRKDELGSLMQSMNEMTEGLLRKEQVEQTFSRYVSPKVAKAVLSNMNQVKLGGQHVEASVLFADIVGFTRLSEELHPEQVNSLLNEYFSIIAQAAHCYGGHIDKYMGDCAMLVFGVPEHDAKHSFHAAACAITIQKLIKIVNGQRKNQNLAQVRFRIGINSGMMLAGNMGAAERMDYTVVGDAVNTASRLASAADAGEILISDELNAALQSQGIVSTRFKKFSLKGKKEAVVTYHVTGVNEKQQAMIDDAISTIVNAGDVSVSK